MALPSSGSISLNQMHIEVGGSSGDACSINDTDIRGLISKASGATMSFTEWYGASAGYINTSLTVGNFLNPATQYTAANNNYGFNDHSRSGLFSTSWGSVGSNSANNIQSGAKVSMVSWSDFSGVGLRFCIDDNATVPNSGWSTLTIGSSTFSRTSATYTTATNVAAQSGTNNAQGTRSQWQWTTAGNPFGTSSGTVLTFKVT